MTLQSNIPDLPFDPHLVDSGTVVNYIYLQQLEQDIIRRRITYLKYYLLKQMEDNGASILRHGNLQAKLKYNSTQYNPSKLHALREVLDETVLQGIYTAPISEWVWIETPEKWDGRGLRGLDKYGKQVQEILTDAKLPNPAIDVIVSKVVDK